MTGRREFLHREFIELLTAENIVSAYRSKKAATNWHEWARQNPSAAALLAQVEMMEGI